MSIDITAILPAAPGRSVPTRRTSTAPAGIAGCYDGSSVAFKLLRVSSWGPGLMNLGYYRFRGVLALINVFANMEWAQQRLVLKALRMLDPRPGQRMLDVACGRGKSSFMAHCVHRGLEVVGLDLLPGNTHVARTLFDKSPDLSYVTGNASNLDFPDASFDRVLCVEAAFHFPDRVGFVKEAARVLRPGGRLVVVDFAWIDSSSRAHRDDPETRHVREVWQWSDLFSIDEYQTVARHAGFETAAVCDWSDRVTRPLQDLFQTLARLGNTTWGRRLLTAINPLYASLSVDEWRQAAYSVKAHDHVNRYSRYMAFAFDKPR